MWRRIFFILILVLIIVASIALLAVSCQAQTYKGQAYIFAAPGTQSVGDEYTLHLGAGGDYFLKRGFAVGGELGYLGLARAYEHGFFVLSGNGSYHFLPARGDAKVVPFVTSGYSLGFRGGSVNLVNFGGGVTWWVARKHGVRLEIRDHLDPRADQHYLGFRIGWTFR